MENDYKQLQKHYRDQKKVDRTYNKKRFTDNKENRKKVERKSGIPTTQFIKKSLKIQKKKLQKPKIRNISKQRRIYVPFNQCKDLKKYYLTP